MKKPPESRTLREIGDLQELVRHVEFFKALEPVVREEMCRVMEIQYFTSGEIVFRKGDPGKYFYVILRGSVSIHVTADLSIAANFLEAGTAFGELALVNDEPRSATISARENAELLIISKEAYRLILKKQHTREINEKVACFAQLPFSENFDKVSLSGLVKASKVMSVPANFVICRQGEMVFFVYMVKSGACRLLKEIKPPDTPFIRPGESITVDRIFRRPSCIVEAENVAQYGYFGENGVLMNRGRASNANSSIKHMQFYPASMVTEVPSEILAVAITDLLRFSDKLQLDALARIAQLREQKLSEDQLGKKLLNQIKWEQEKTRLLSEMNLPRYNRGAEKRKEEQIALRTPPKRPDEQKKGSKVGRTPSPIYNNSRRRTSFSQIFFDPTNR